jgi:hypothetical protein|nr:MAG TPA: hypothetical protein [Caudoviricetes sp.]
MAEAILMSGGVGGVSSDDVTATKNQVLQGVTALTRDSDDEPIQGTIPIRGYKGPDSSEFSYYPPEGGYLTRVEEGYYHKSGGYKPYVIVPTAKVKQAVNYHPEKTLSDTNTCGEQGQIPIWSPSVGDVAIANQSHSGQGFAYDLPGVGRGIVVGIKNDSYIQGANYVFFPMSNLLPHNLRAGENFAGITGTMPDYSSGRMVFRGATFDGTIATGVAKKGFVLNGINRYYDLRDSLRRCEGVNDGGIKFLNTYYQNTRQRSAEDIGCVLSNSINLTPFRQIKVGFVVFNFKGDGTEAQPAKIELEVGVASTANVGGEVAQSLSDYPVRNLGGRARFISHVMTSTSRNAGNLSDKTQKYLTLDVSDLQGQHFLYFLLGNIQHEYSSGWVHATVLVNSIQVIN